MTSPLYVPYDKLLPDVVQILLNEGVDEDSFNKNRALYAIQQAYKEFVRDTHTIRRVISLKGQEGVCEYKLFKYDEHVVNKIYLVTVEHPCDPPTCYKPGKICSCNCCPNTFGYQDGILTLCPAPVCDGMDIDICVSLFPESDACEMDDRLYELYREYIAAGAASKLLKATLAITYREHYSVGKSIAASESATQWAKRAVKKGASAWRRR